MTTIPIAPSELSQFFADMDIPKSLEMIQKEHIQATFTITNGDIRYDVILSPSGRYRVTYVLFKEDSLEIEAGEQYLNEIEEAKQYIRQIYKEVK